MRNMKNNLKGGIILLIAAAIWGSAFVAQEKAVPFIGAFTINCLRSLVASAVLFPIVLILKRKRERLTEKPEKTLTKPLILGGVLCGIALSVAINLQQFGIMFNAKLAEGGSGKAGFITAMYIIFVPLFSVILGKKLKFSMLLAVIVSVFGLYFISVKSGFTVSTGDLVLLLCAVSFAVHITIADRFVSRVDAVALSAIQFFTVGVVSGILMLIFERDSLSIGGILAAALPILYCGVMSSGVAYTFQLIGQIYCESTVASIIMSLESLFAMITSCIFFKMLPTSREAVGCVLMMLAIFIVETPFANRVFDKIFKRKKKNEA